MSAEDIVPPSPQHRDAEVLQHVLREVRSGRPLDEVMGDAYVTEREEADTHAKVLDHPEVAQAVGDEIIAEMRRLQAELQPPSAKPAADAGDAARPDELAAEIRRVTGES